MTARTKNAKNDHDPIQPVKGIDGGQEDRFHLDRTNQENGQRNGKNDHGPIQKIDTKSEEQKPKNDHGQIRHSVTLPIDCIYPSTENEKLYRPVVCSDPEIVALAESIKKNGLLEPIVITLDNVIISGHRRHMACRLAGIKKLKCRVEPIHSSHDRGRFIELLREANRQRVKNHAEMLREEVISMDPAKAYEQLLAERQSKSDADVADAGGETGDLVAITGQTTRAEITAAKKPFLEAIQKVIESRKDFWPLSVRQIHYALLNDPPLIHASKRKSTYRNDMASYRACIDLCARGRLAKLIPWPSIDDETRSISCWDVHASITPFFRKQMDGMFNGYFRDLLQSQSNQIEVIGEKNTIAGIIKPIAQEYCVPMTIGRGYTSLPPRQKMFHRYLLSGKQKLVLIVLSDHDCEGEDIPHSFARSMRDDFGLQGKDIVTVKAALTSQQVKSLKLAENNTEAKAGSSRMKKFVAKYGKKTYELEALEPVVLQEILRQAIEDVLDMDAFEKEVEAEKKEAASLIAARQQIQKRLLEMDLPDSTA